MSEEIDNYAAPELVRFGTISELTSMAKQSGNEDGKGRRPPGGKQSGGFDGKGRKPPSS
jgi:hypothetical protein